MRRGGRTPPNRNRDASCPSAQGTDTWAAPGRPGGRCASRAGRRRVAAMASATSEVGQPTRAPRLRDAKARTMAAAALLLACAGFALGNGTAAVTSADPDVKALDARVSSLEADNARLTDVVNC